MEADPTRRPTLVVNPTDDYDFRSFADGLMDDGLLEPTTLQDALRGRHPHALVRPRELAGEHAQVWYVYRDGHWVRPGLPSDHSANGHVLPGGTRDE